MGGICFAGDTKILMADHSQKQIKDVVIGDKVLSYDTHNNNFITTTVTKLFTPIHDDMVKIKWSHGETTHNTFDHPFYDPTTKSWMSYRPSLTKGRYDFTEVKELTVDSKGVAWREGAVVENTVLHIEENNESTQTYIFELDQNHTFFANGVLTHNKGGGGGNPVSRAFKKAFSFIGDIVEGIVKIFTSPFGLDMTVPDVSASQSDSIGGVLVNKDSGIAAVPVVYGTRMVGGARVFVSTNGSGNEYLYVAYVLSEGQVNGYTKLLIDDIEVAVTNKSHGVESAVTTAPYSEENRLRVQFFDGRDDQVSSSLLQEAPGWGSSHRLRGLAYIACRFRWKKIKEQEDADNNPYAGNVPNIKVIVEGRKIFDLADGYSPASVGSVTGQTGSSSGLFGLKTTTATLYHSLSAQTGDLTFQDNDITFTLTSDAEVKIVQTGTLNNTGQQDSGAFVTQTLNLTTAGGGAISGGSRTQTASVGGRQKTTTITFEQNYSLSAGDYKVDFGNNTTKFGSPTYDVTFYNLLEVIIPEVEDHTVEYANEPVTFTNNPANVLLDYMRNPRYGKGLANDAFDWVTWRKAAVKCDQVVSYTSSTTGKAFTCDAVIDTQASIMNNCKVLLVGFRGLMPYTQGKFKLIIEDAGDPNDTEAIPSDPPVAFTATSDNIVGGLALIGDNKEARYNRCRVTYIDPDADYSANEIIYPEDGSAEDLAFLDEDNNQRFDTTVSLTTVAHREQALQYGEVLVKRSRNAKQIQFATTIAGSNVAVGDLCRVISENIGLDGIFRITDIRLNSEGDIQITGFEHQPTIYAINAKADDITRPSINLPDPLSVPAPTGLTLVSSGQELEGTDTTTGYVGSVEKIHRIKASWTATADPFFDRYVVQFKKSSDTDFITAGFTSDLFFFIPVVANTDYDVRVASENELARRSAFVTVSNHTVDD